MQEDVGLQSATDGEFRRTSWHMDFIYQLGGVGQTDEKMQVHFRNDDGRARLRVGRAERARPDLAAATRSSATTSRSCRIDVAAGQTPKLTIPSPSMVHYRGGRAAIDPAVYPDLDEFWADLTAAYAEQVRRARRARLHLPAARRHQPGLPQRPGAARACSPRRATTPSTSTSATSATSTPPSPTGPTGMHVTTHMCRGNFRSSWAAEGGYDFVAEALFSELDVDGFFLEYDDERSGGFEPLRFVPPGKMVVLGLVTTKRGALESKDDLKRRIDEAAKYVAARAALPVAAVRLLLDRRGQRAHATTRRSPSCALIVETAAEVWG